MKMLVAVLLLFALPFVAFAEGRCPPGQYPIGDSRAPGCAPIPGGGASDGQQGPVATGKWETRWGAIAEDSSTLTTGAAFSMKSKRRAVSAAMAECNRLGGGSSASSGSPITINVWRLRIHQQSRSLIRSVNGGDGRD